MADKIWNDICPMCNALLPVKTVRPNSSEPKKSHTTTQFMARVCPECGHVVPPRTGQNNSAIVESGSMEERADNIGFTHPNLHRRIKYCVCGEEWVCQLHKNIGPCDCKPGVECECAMYVDDSIQYARCTDWNISSDSNIRYAKCLECVGAGTSCATCIDSNLIPLIGRQSDRGRPNESYKLGIYGQDSHKTTETHMHNENQTHIEHS